MRIDSSRTTLPIKRRYEAERDPIVRRNLKVVLDHVEAEIRGDLEAILATLVPEPVYHIYNVTAADGTTMVAEVRGAADVRAMYVSAIKAGSAQLQDYDITMLVADQNGVGNDGYLRVAWDGASLKAMGYAASADASYLYEGRLCSFWPFHASGLLLGEDIYFDPAGFRNILDKKLETR